MKRTNRTAAALLAASAALAVGAAPAVAKKGGHKHVVKSGESIQKAIDAAKPGDTIVVKKGTYAENLTITKNRIKLVGHKATLTQPATPSENLCSTFEEGKVTGICIAGSTTQGPQGPTVTSTVNGVRVDGFTIKGFSSNGVFIYGGKKTKLTHSRLVDNGAYGVFSNTSTGTVYARDLAKGNKAPGFYIGDSPKSKSLVKGVVSRDNLGEGLLLRNATHGEVRGSTFRGNCAGVLVLADAPGPAGNWKIHGNIVRDNNGACAGEADEGEPPVSGLGIGLIGANDTKVLGNVVIGHTAANPSFQHGGIVVAKGPGGTAPVNDLVRGNSAHQNAPNDLFWDKSGSVTFKNNACSSSDPTGLCTKRKGKGKKH